ncbi:Hypothetical predicted protein, partial [Scomber scombrus]
NGSIRSCQHHRAANPLYPCTPPTTHRLREKERREKERVTLRRQDKKKKQEKYRKK